MKVLKEIISTVNNAEFDSKGDPLYSYTQLEDCMKKYAIRCCRQLLKEAYCNSRDKMKPSILNTEINLP